MKSPNFIRLATGPRLPKDLQMLKILTDNVRWIWYPQAIELLRMIDPALWERSGHSPRLFLSWVAHERLEEVAADSFFLAAFHSICERYQKDCRPAARLPLAEHDERRSCIAYFSLEFGLHESLPLYSGGLGVLAGDHLKSASDLNIPLVAVGLFYRQGYFIQRLDSNGRQIEEYHENDLNMIPVHPVRDAEGKPLHVSVPLAGQELCARVWELCIGNIALYLLDTDIDENPPQLREVTFRLYGGDHTMRLHQELLLGVGGYAALKKMNYLPNACHMNEGHSVFLNIARTLDLQKRYRLPIEEALELNRQTNIFTTHTPVPAGNEVFEIGLLWPYIERLLQDTEWSTEQFMALGQAEGHDSGRLSMTILGLRCATFANGVSRLHGEVARNMWRHIWPQLSAAEVPIESITNGVHPGSWVSSYHQDLFRSYLSPNWETKADWSEAELGRIERIPDSALLKAHKAAKAFLIEQLQNRGAKKLCTDTLTIGFARRFATYKRATLLLRDPDRLERLIRNPKQPVQFLFAGKAHPADEPGKHLIKSLIDFARERELEDAFVFIENYNIEVARLLVQGVDVWLNNPVRPEEASGTSGMKAAMNGVPNFSILDGWWAEGYSKDCGWTIPGSPNPDPNQRDSEEAQNLYRVLENEIIPSYYFLENEIPVLWVRYMKSAIQSSLHTFSSHRMVGEYYRRYYQPAMQRYQALTADEAAPLRKFCQNKRRLQEAMPNIRISEPILSNNESKAANEILDISVCVEHEGLRPEDLVVEVYLSPNRALNAEPEGFSQEQGAVFSLRQSAEGDALQTGEQSMWRLSLESELLQGRARGLYTALGVRVCPKDTMLRNLSPGFMVWY